MTSPNPRRDHHVDGQLARQIAILFICVVSVALLLISVVIESTSPYLVLLPTLLGAFTISRMRMR